MKTMAFISFLVGRKEKSHQTTQLGLEIGKMCFSNSEKIKLYGACTTNRDVFNQVSLYFTINVKFSA